MESHLVASLVALNERTRQAWAHPHNKGFYTPASFQGSSVRDGKSRESTPGDADMNNSNYVHATEPEIRLFLDHRPKNMRMGWVFGSDRNTCDVYCGEYDKSQRYNIGRQTFSITINNQGQVVLNHLKDTNRTQVKYDDQKPGDRHAFVWIMLPNCRNIFVITANQLKFQVIVVNPDKLTEHVRSSRSRLISYFLTDVKDSMPLLSADSGPRSAYSAQVSTPKTQPFYYVHKDRPLGNGAFGQVHIVVDVSTGIEYAGKKFFGDFYRSEANILAKQNHVSHLIFFDTWCNCDNPA